MHFERQYHGTLIFNMILKLNDLMFVSFGIYMVQDTSIMVVYKTLI